MCLLCTEPDHMQLKAYFVPAHSYGNKLTQTAKHALSLTCINWNQAVIMEPGQMWFKCLQNKLVYITSSSAQSLPQGLQAESLISSHKILVLRRDLNGFYY